MGGSRAGREHSGERYLSSYLSTWLQGPLLPFTRQPGTIFPSVPLLPELGQTLSWREGVGR